LYSWPSSGTTSGYLSDYDASLDATEAFNQFLSLLKNEAGVSRVHVIAHSIGNWLVANALRERALASKGSPTQLIDQLVLAAPDIWADRFRDRFLATLPKFARRVTLYVSDNDRALKASTSVRGGIPRAGLRAGGLLSATADGFDVVDATDLPAEFLDHSYYANNESMLADMFCLFHGSLAGQRPLIQPLGVNWRFKELAQLKALKANACVAVDADNQPVTIIPPLPTSPLDPSASVFWFALLASILLASYMIAVRVRRRRTLRALG
jgi:esterase/lipase superfamily enzyme